MKDIQTIQKTDSLDNWRQNQAKFIKRRLRATSDVTVTASTFQPPNCSIQTLQGRVAAGYLQDMRTVGHTSGVCGHTSGVCVQPWCVWVTRLDAVLTAPNIF